MLKTITKKESGYTIIETMISVSLFLIVVMSGMGALLNANLLHQKSQDIRSIIDNLSFVMDDISRNLRTGYNYQCFRKQIDLTLSPGALGVSRSCASGWAIAFEEAEGNRLTYDDQWVYYISEDGKIFRSTDGANNFTQLTPDEVVISQISGFSVLGAEPLSVGNNQQPFVVIRLTGTITTKDVITPFSLQASISGRLIDI